MNLNQQSFFLFIATFLIFRINFCNAGVKVARTPASVLAQKTGATHFEERFEKISSEEENRHHIRKRASNEDDFDYEVYQGVVGRPGIDFPILPRIPQTSFSCRTYGNGYFADLETECQVFHICDDGRKISFLCPNGTIFQQTELICDWWFKVNCATSPGYYSESSEILSRSQNRKSKPMFKNDKQNEYHETNVHDRPSRKQPRTKSDYQNKSYKKYEQNSRTNRNRKDSNRNDSDEILSVENFDFEDITEPVTLTNKNEKFISQVDTNEAEMQDVAESASFVGNGHRRNGYVYNNPKEDVTSPIRVKNNYKNSEKTKVTNRGRQRYNDDANKYVSKALDNEEDLPKVTKQMNENLATLFEQRQDRKQNLDKKSNIVSSTDIKETTQQAISRSRPNTYTTARRIDTTRTTPYYTPTIPTILNRATLPGAFHFKGEAMQKNQEKLKEEKYSSKPIEDFSSNIKSIPGSTPNSLNVDGIEKQSKYASYRNFGTTNRISTYYETEITSVSPEFQTIITESFGRKISTAPSLIRDMKKDANENDNHASYETILSSEQLKGTTQSFFQNSPLYEQNISSRKENLNLLEKIVSMSNKRTTSSFIQTTQKPVISELRGTLLDSTRSSHNISQAQIIKFLPDLSFNQISSKTNSLFHENYVTPSIQSFSTTPTYSTAKLYFTTSTQIPEETTTLRPSSSGPTYLPKPALSSAARPLDVTEHVKEMVKSLNELKKELKMDTECLKKDENKYVGKTRPGLEIPPSSGPETLHSLALYFAGEDENSFSTIKNDVVLANISTSLLSNKTVQNYKKLLGLGTTEPPIDSTLSPDFKLNFSSDTNDLEAQNSNGPLGNSVGKSETRKIAQVFTNALSAYLEDPDSFRRTLAEIRPTVPSVIEYTLTNKKTTSKYFNRGTAASYLPTVGTTISPTTIDDLEDLDFSDGAIRRKDSQSRSITTTEIPTTERIRTYSDKVDKTPASRLLIERFPKRLDNAGFQDLTTTEPNEVAMEINKGLSISTSTPVADTSRQSKQIKTKFNNTSIIHNSSNVKPYPQVRFDLLPPVGTLEALHPDILPLSFDDDEESLQRAQSQSFAASRNRLHKEISKSNQSGNQPKTTTTKSDQRVTKTTPSTKTPSTEGYSPNPLTSLAYTVFLDPLTINEGLTDDIRRTTASSYTYLPKGTTATIEPNPVQVNLSSMLKHSKYDTEVLTNRLGKAYEGIPEELLPPKDGMQRIANKMFGSLNETSADHLMNVMKKAESNQTVRRLILLLIQTCGDDYNKAVEQSRQALLNALIGMDEKLSIEDEIEVIKLKPNRRGKNIKPSNGGPHEIIPTTTELPLTTFRPHDNTYIPTTSSSIPSIASTLEPIQTTTHSNSLEETTRFEIRVEDSDDVSSTTLSRKAELEESTSTTTETPTTISYNTISVTNTSSLRRKAKDIEDLSGQSSSNHSSANLRHKNSDERALELLKSLYSLASKFSRR